jgi:DNA-binding transcriptional LysR family regulator
MKIETLKYIVEINNLGSFSSVAEKLHISQPTISQSVAKLEETLDVKIFNRSRSGARPTEPGKIIIEKAIEVIQKIEEIECTAQSQSSLLEASLNIVTIPSLSTTLLPKTLGNFKKKFPKVKIEVFETGSLQAIDKFTEGDIDIGLVSRQNESDFDDRYIFEPLLEGTVKACVNNNHSLSNKGFISIEQIINYPVVVSNPNQYRVHSYILKLLREIREPDILMTATNPESLKRVIVEGLAIGFYSDIVLKNDPYVKSGDIVPIDIINQDMKTYFGVIFRKSKQLSPVVKEFINELKKQTTNLNI